jgi:hypothetical protein
MILQKVLPVEVIYILKDVDVPTLDGKFSSNSFHCSKLTKFDELQNTLLN